MECIHIDDLNPIDEFDLSENVTVIIIPFSKKSICLDLVDEFDEIRNIERAYYVKYIENAKAERKRIEEKRLEYSEENYLAHRVIRYKLFITIKDPTKPAEITIHYAIQPTLPHHPTELKKTQHFYYKFYYLPPDYLPLI